MKAKVTRQLGAVESWQSPLIQIIDGRRVVPVGTIIDQDKHPETDCVRLVRNGEGVPVDDECLRACSMTPQQIDAAQKAIQRMYSIDDESETEDEEGDDE